MINFDYIKAVESAKKHGELHQYTQIEALEYIINNRALLFKRIDKLNDTIENKKNSNIWKSKIYTACFTHRKCESYFFWETYAKGNPNGVRVSFNSEFLRDLSLHPDEQCKQPSLLASKEKDYDIPFSADVTADFWEVYDYTLIDVVYVPRNMNMDDITRFQGRFKYEEWDMECETRARVAVRPIGRDAKNKKTDIEYLTPNNERLFGKLSQGCLESMKITLNPYANENLENRVNELLRKNGLYGKIKVNKSILLGEIQRNV